MAQLKLFDIELPQKPVNVATVPQRSPFRYPGGKTWFVPYARRWLSQYKGRVHYIEAFAGGSIIGLTAAFENLAQSVLLVEIDPDIAAVWKTILSGNGKWLAKKMLSFEVTPENVANELSKPINSVYQRGFITLLKNRLHHGGILADGAGLLKNGENGKGLLSRWYPKTIYKRILDILEVKDKIQFLEEDGLGVIKKNFYNNKCVFFVDPPYTKAAKRLIHILRLTTRNYLSC